jgi:hypothetical protein
MPKVNSIVDFLTRKSNPIGDFLGRALSPWMARLLRDHPEDYRRVKETEDKYNDWMRKKLGITIETPELWKSLLLYTILICGFGILLYVFFSRS